MMQKVGRNDPCPCGSGKKYKKCCEEKLKHKKFEATLMTPDPEKASITKAAKLSTSFFQKKVAAPAVHHEPPQDHPTETKPI